MFENLNQKQFEEILQLVITYKKLHPKENVYFNEKCCKKAFEWFRNVQKNPSAGLLGK